MLRHDSRRTRVCSAPMMAAMLCGVVRCGVVLCCVVWCCAVLCCVVWCCAVWCDVVLCGVVLCCQIMEESPGLFRVWAFTDPNTLQSVRVAVRAFHFHSYPLLSSPLFSSPLLSSLLLSSPLFSSPLFSSPLLSSPLLSFPLLSSPLLSFPLLSSPLLSSPLLSSPLLSCPLRVLRLDLLLRICTAVGVSVSCRVVSCRVVSCRVVSCRVVWSVMRRRPPLHRCRERFTSTAATSTCRPCRWVGGDACVSVCRVSADAGATWGVGVGCGEWWGGVGSGEVGWGGVGCFVRCGEWGVVSWGGGCGRRKMEERRAIRFLSLDVSCAVVWLT